MEMIKVVVLYIAVVVVNKTRGSAAVVDFVIKKMDIVASAGPEKPQTAVYDLEIRTTIGASPPTSNPTREGRKEKSGVSLDGGSDGGGVQYVVITVGYKGYIASHHVG